MKRYIKEMANDVQREIDREIKACRIPFGDLAELGRSISHTIRYCKEGLETDRGTVREILNAWDKLKELQWENA